MSATFALKKLNVRTIGSNTTVPKNAMAKIKYYLDCVFAVVDYHDSTLTDYKNYDEIKVSKIISNLRTCKIISSFPFYW